MTSSNVFIATGATVQLAMKRDDLLDPLLPGNKLRKLKYNLLEARKNGHDTLLTFGGAFSNHIAAVALAGKTYGFKAIGIIRGEELAGRISENPTLLLATGHGMHLEFISREAYGRKDEAGFLESLRTQFGDFYMLPEGGTNALAVKGCEEILTAKDSSFDYICCPVGTGGTIAGLINSAAAHQTVLGFPALKGDFLNEEIAKFAHRDNWRLITDYHFGGYAKANAELIRFMNRFYSETKIPLDPVYTAKMVFGVMDMISKGFFKAQSKILMIHTGGLQGISGMNQRLKNKNLPLIDYHD